MQVRLLHGRLDHDVELTFDEHFHTGGCEFGVRLAMLGSTPRGSSIASTSTRTGGKRKRYLILQEKITRLPKDLSSITIN